MRITTLCLAFFAPPAAAHEFWIEPLEWQIGEDDTMQARLVNGEDFEGIEFAYLPQRFGRFDIYEGGTAMPVVGRTGDTPALRFRPASDGLAVASYESIPHTVTYDDFEVFGSFVEHKDLGDVLARHAARGLPETGFAEVFSRYAKTLVSVGDGAGDDQRTGLETEIVVLDNPYVSDPADGIRVQVFYGDALRTDTQVELFDRGPDGAVALTLHRTDDAGIATLPVAAGHDYLVSAVVLREPDAALAASSGAVWESLWASLTFAVPD